MRQQPTQLSEVPWNEQTPAQRQQTLQQQRLIQERQTQQEQQRQQLTQQRQLEQQQRQQQAQQRQQQQELQRQQQELQRATQKAAQAAQQPVREENVAQPKPKPQPAPVSAATESPAPKQEAAKKDERRYMVQCGSFKGAEPAEKVRAQLAFEGFDSHITTNNGWNRVVIGPLNGKDSADSTLSRLKSAGHTSCIRVAAGG